MVRAWLNGIALVFGVALPAACASSPLEHRWSDPATWHGRVPRAGDAVTIASGEAVVLDVAPPHLSALTIDGGLRFADRDLTLQTGNVTVHGILRIGSDDRPFVHRARIVLDATSDGRGAIAVSNGGELELHGAPRVAWTTLAATALPGARTLTLAQNVDWQPGDRVALAPSGFTASEAEELTIAAVSANTVRLAEPLRYRHWGTVTDGVDERAEIGLLSHTIAIEGEPVAAARGIGGQVLVLRGGTLHASDTEFRHLGRRGKRGRYPIHFHQAGDAADSRVVDSSIDHSFNRCLTIHGSNGVLVRGNVAFDTFGHCYFLEDGNERGNVFEGNLGMLTRAPAAADRILDTDVRPATFWIANPDNVVRGNHAAGSEGTGFWYGLGVTPGGLAAALKDVRPRHTDLATFADDVAHSNEHDGLFVDNLRNPPGVTDAPNYEPPHRAIFTGFSSYKNRRHGVWLRGRNLELANAILADNAIGATFAAAQTTLDDSLVIGETGNRTGPPKPDDPSFPIRGFEFYDGPVSVTQTHFVNFVPDARRTAGALSALEFSPFFMDPHQTAAQLTFTNAQPVYFRPFTLVDIKGVAADGYRSAVFADVDGSVTGRASSYVVIDTPLLSDGCTRVARWNAAICDARFGSIFVVDGDSERRGIGPIRITALTGQASPPSIALAGNPTYGALHRSFQTNVVSGRSYLLQFGGRIPHHLTLSVHGMNDGETIGLRIPQLGSCVAPEGMRLVAHGLANHAFARVDLVCSSGR